MNQSIVFFGSGPVAAKSLALLAQTFTIEAIITKPATVHEMASVMSDTPVLEVSNKQGLNELIATQHFTSRLAVLIDFGIIVSKQVIDSFPLGIINSHFSVLPEWRGADPISFAILSGQSKTGVSLMLIDEGMDTGNILTTKVLPISPIETPPSLTDKLIELSNALLQEYIPKYIAGTVSPRQQSHPGRATYSRKLTKEDGIIDWNKPAAVLEREIRAFIEWPKSRTTFNGKDVIITKAHAVPSQPQSSKPGNIDIAEQIKEFGVITGSGTLWIDELKPAGKKEMPAKAFLAGYRQFLK